ncbi:alpha/beta hydrolase [Paraflavitalea soli]|uniref:Proline iminopeptidase n=1 Tax=Paraflavitalea soli TaxID=2315862 RepID=A0A3B7MLN3_9BACT|nr:alpha/beta hydrolase [Paraflavitalea soli]AXY74627.1 alpha/beta hydrolase [Paraflavitalea soli]
MPLRSLYPCVMLLLLYLLPITPLSAQSPSSRQDTMSEEKFVQLNGIEQWITIKGNKSKPMILFIHGGPGSPITPYADNVYKEWEKDFLLVQWDQRGTGRTYGKAPVTFTPEYLQSHLLTIEQMAADGIALAEYLVKYLGKPKMIIMGTSWGSALSVKIISQRPDLFYAYIGHSQIVDPSNDGPMYDKVYRLAQQHNDTASLRILNALGKPPYDRARNVGQLLRVVKKYEKASSTPPPPNWFVETASYNNPKDEQDRNDGDDYSFVNYAGDKVLGVPSIRAGINFRRDIVELKIPVYLIQGEEDILTPKTASKAWFDQLRAPLKEYILLPKAAHGFNQSVVDTQYKLCKSVKMAAPGK